MLGIQLPILMSHIAQATWGKKPCLYPIQPYGLRLLKAHILECSFTVKPTGHHHKPAQVLVSQKGHPPTTRRTLEVEWVKCLKGNQTDNHNFGGSDP